MRKISAKRRSLSVADQLSILSNVDENPTISKNIIAQKFNFPNSTLSTIISKRADIERAAVEGSMKRKN